MLLYTLTNASAVTVGDDTWQVVDGEVDVPSDLGVTLRDRYVGGVKVWEDSIERQARLAAEEEARRRDPMTLLAAVEALSRPAEVVEIKHEPEPAKPAPRKRTPRKP